MRSRAMLALLGAAVGLRAPASHATVIEIFGECGAGSYPCATSLAAAANMARVPGLCAAPCVLAFRGVDEATALPIALGPQTATNLHGTADSPIIITTAVAARAQVLTSNHSGAGVTNATLLTLSNCSWIIVANIELIHNDTCPSTSSLCDGTLCTACPLSSHITFQNTMPALLHVGASATLALSLAAADGFVASQQRPATGGFVASQHHPTTRDQSLAQQLGALQFRHNGTVSATDSFVLAGASCGYLEVSAIECCP